MTLCEFQTTPLLPHGRNASAIIGIMGSKNAFKIEVRLNQMPLQQEESEKWLTKLLGLPIHYAPLSPFP